MRYPPWIAFKKAVCVRQNMRIGLPEDLLTQTELVGTG